MPNYNYMSKGKEKCTTKDLSKGCFASIHIFCIYFFSMTLALLGTFDFLESAADGFGLEALFDLDVL